MMNIKISTIMLATVLVGFVFLTSGSISAAVAKTDRPNILVIFGDDVGMWNVGDTEAAVQNTCGEPDSQIYQMNAWVYNFGPSQPVYTVIFKDGQVAKILEDECGS